MLLATYSLPIWPRLTRLAFYQHALSIFSKEVKDAHQVIAHCMAGGNSACNPARVHYIVHINEFASWGKLI